MITISVFAVVGIIVIQAVGYAVTAGLFLRKARRLAVATEAAAETAAVKAAAKLDHAETIAGSLSRSVNRLKEALGASEAEVRDLKK